MATLEFGGFSLLEGAKITDKAVVEKRNKYNSNKNDWLCSWMEVRISRGGVVMLVTRQCWRRIEGPNIMHIYLWHILNQRGKAQLIVVEGVSSLSMGIGIADGRRIR